MKKTLINIIRISFFTLLICPYADAATSPDNGFPGLSLDSIINLNQSHVNDIYTPLTHFGKGDTALTFSPVYFNVAVVVDSSKAKITGDGLSGYGGGLTFSSAFTDRFFFDLNYAYSTVSGDMLVSFPDYGINNDVYVITVKNKAHYGKAGLGFDIIKSKSWSMPVIVGGYLKYLDADVVTKQYKSSGYTVNEDLMNGKGSGTVWGASATVVLSYKLDGMKISPYVTFIKDFNELEIENLKLHSPKVNGRDNPSSILPGFSLAYVSGKDFDFTFSLSGVLFTQTNYYNDLFLMGLKTQNYMLSITYKNL